MRPNVHEICKFAPPLNLLLHGRLNGFGTPKQHVARAVELGLSAFALTEHGNVSSHVQLEREALEVGIKPIFGCELYTGDVGEGRSKWKWHLTVLAENEVGYQNLMRLVTLGWAEGFYFEPTVSGQMLADHAEGLIVLSGCLGSKMVTDLIGGKGREEHIADGPAMKEAEATARRFKALLGDRFYLEVQAFPELDKTRAVNAAWERISKRTGIPIVATGDVHYPRPEDSKMQVILHAAGRGKNTFEKQLQGWGYDIPLTDPLSDKVMLKRLIDSGLSRSAAQGAIDNSAIIGSRCSVTLPKAERLRFPLPPKTTNEEYLWALLREGWKRRRFGLLPKGEQKKAAEQLKYEVSIFVEKDFVDYFLMLADLVGAGKDRGIVVGPARGSAAASLACYLLRITEVNPMHYPTMFFERFIDLTRMDLPDVDLDFEDERRSEMWDIAKARYGDDHVGTIGSYTRYRGKNSIDDVGHVFRVPPYELDTVKDLIIERSGGDSRFDASLEDTIGMFPQAAAVFEKHPNLSNAFRLEGNYKGMGVHAAGMVIANSSISDVCALYTRLSGKDKRPTSVLSVDKKDAEYLNLLKADFLSLKTLGMVAIALDLIGMSLDELYAIPMDEKRTINAFRNNDVIGIFQFEGRATRLVNRDVVPDHFMHLSDVNALSRPGPLFSGTTNEYIEVKQGRKKAESLHPALDRITGFTYGQIIYQEQILQIVRELGGFPWTAASIIRKIISQKKGEAAFNEMFDQFKDGAKELHGIDAKLALVIWKKLATSGTYAFNVAHSVSYSMLAFWCMWLKVHYPVEFYAAQLTKASGKDKGAAWAKLMKDAQDHDIEVRPPSLDLSGITWGKDKTGGIIAGFSQIPGIGDSMSRKIIGKREERGGFDTWDDLIEVNGIGVKSLEKIKDFAENADPFRLNHARDVLALVKEDMRTGSIPLIIPRQNSDALLLEDSGKKQIRWMGIVKAREYKDFIEDQRARSGETVEEIRKGMKAPDLVTSCVLHAFDDGSEDVYLRVNRFSFNKFKEQLESIQVGLDVVYVIGTKRQNAFGISIFVENLVIIDPTPDDDEDEEESE